MHGLCNDAQLQAFPGRPNLLTLGTTFLRGFKDRFQQDLDNRDDEGAWCAQKGPADHQRRI